MTRYSRPRPITNDDDLSAFSCGEPSLDEWLRRFALANHLAGGSRCFVTCRQEKVVGYYALATASIQHDDATRRVRQGMPRPIPAVLLGRLAVDQKEQGHGLGKHLLRDAIIRTLDAADLVGVRVLLVDALSEDARAFYLRFDFEPSPTDAMHLMLLLKDARALLHR